MKYLLPFILLVFTNSCNNSIRSIQENKNHTESKITIYAFVDYGCGYCGLLKEYFEKQNPCEKCIEVIYLKEKSKSNIQLNCPKEIILKDAKEFNKILPLIKIYDNNKKRVIKSIKGFWPEKLDKFMINQCED